jgi:hypothetical protein
VITKSVMLQTLCVPCACRCRYCLLSWNGKAIGADYARSERFAERFYTWLQKERPDLSFHFSFGYSMDHPILFDALDFMNRIGSVSGKFLQCDGMAFRTETELNDLLCELKKHGVESLNFTFYGTQAYHDRFAGRNGDHEFLLCFMEMAARIGFKVSAGVPLTKENIEQMDDLFTELEEHGGRDTRLFVPHGEGRGAALENIRVSRDDLSMMSAQARAELNQKVYQTESEWCTIKGGEPEQNRSLLISLTNNNIGQLEQMPFSEIIAEVEALDEAYYAAFPSFKELLNRYGDREGNKLYSRRDLFHRCRQQYDKEFGIEVYDVTDERQSGSRRY